MVAAVPASEMNFTSLPSYLSVHGLNNYNNHNHNSNNHNNWLYSCHLHCARLPRISSNSPTSYRGYSEIALLISITARPGRGCVHGNRGSAVSLQGLSGTSAKVYSVDVAPEPFLSHRC